MMNAMSHLQPGQQLDRYLLESEIGAGGMGIVYRAQHQLLGTWVALKVLDPRLASDARFVQRFALEAQTAARLQHPNIVKVSDVGQAEGWYFIVMEFLEGIPLDRWLREHQRCSPQEAVGILRQVAAALDHAHAHNLVHRDVKPANILLRDGADEHAARQAILTDFGIAKILEGVQLTATGMSMGTPDYMAPEQVSGDPVGAQTDVYALGVVYFEMLTNVLPFSADTPIAVLLKHMSDEPPSPRLLVPDLPVTLDEVLHRALAKKPRERYASAGEFAAAIDRAVA